MALSDANIGVYVSKELAEYTAGAYADYGSTKDQLHHFARAIEAEVRKSDEALIRQLVDALDECKDSTQERIDTLTESGIDKHKPRYFRSYVQDLQRATDAISAARARLEGKP